MSVQCRLSVGCVGDNQRNMRATSDHQLISAKTRIQALPADSKGKGKDERTMASVMLEIYQKEGIIGLYRGFGATMLNTFSMRMSASS